MSAPLMNKIVQENPQPDPFVYVDDSSMNFEVDSQIPAGPTKWKKPHERTSYTHTQHEELKALFSCNMNWRFKKRKQQQQQEQQLVLPSKNVPTASTSPHSFLPAVSDSYSFHSPQPLDPFHWAGDSIVTEIATSDVQMQDPQLERLVASVPALYSDAYDIAQIMELYRFPDEDEIASSSFHSLFMSWANLLQYDKLELYSLQSKRQPGIPEPLQYGTVWMSLIK
ncbi:hypothetical protein E2I00_007009, partial [Balaenoptera physalus]